MWRRATIIALTLMLGAAISFAGRPQIILVQGQDDINVDREAVQDALDAAQPGDTVELAGTFQFDGVEVFITKSRLTLTGIALDNDGDGEVNEDWTDGVDNDGDGEVDEDDWDAAIHGLAEYEDGPPVRDRDRDTLFNRAVGIKGGSGDLRGIAVRHLKFYTVLRGVEVIGGHFSYSHDCDDLVYTGDEIDGVVVEKNLFDNTRRGAQIFGTVANASFRDNLAIGSLGYALLVVGDEVACRLEGDESEFTGVLSIDRPQRIEISGNRVLNGLWAGIGVVTSDKTEVMHNVVTGEVVGVHGYGDSPGTRIANNTIFDSGTGVYLEEASNFTLVNNEFWASWWVDVHLLASSHDNTVIATDFHTTVYDEGYDNKLIGTLAMIYNPGISDEVRQHLEEVRARIAAKQAP
jgi:parallel beta-helix repeat protein